MKKLLATIFLFSLLLALPTQAENGSGGIFMDWLSNILAAADKVNNGGTADDLDVIVEDYFLLIKNLHTDSKPERVTLSEENFALLTVDGIEYDLYLVPHDDGDNTNRRMEIEILLNEDTPISVIEEKLNTMIQEEW